MKPNIILEGCSTKMLKFNEIVYYIGMIMTLIGLFVGIPALILGYQALGKYMTTILVPFGFLLWFTGFTAYTLIRPNVREGESEMPEALKERQRYQREMPD